MSTGKNMLFRVAYTAPKVFFPLADAGTTDWETYIVADHPSTALEVALTKHTVSADGGTYTISEHKVTIHASA